MTEYLGTLLLTIAIELVVVFSVGIWRKSWRGSIPAFTCCSLNLVTHPLANIAHFALGVPLAPIELTVILLEALGYWRIARISPGDSLVLSLVANVLSMMFGFLLFPAN